MSSPAAAPRRSRRRCGRALHVASSRARRSAARPPRGCRGRWRRRGPRAARRRRDRRARACRRCAAASRQRVGEQTLAPEDHDVLAAVAQQAGELERRGVESPRARRGQRRTRAPPGSSPRRRARSEDRQSAFGSSALGRALAIAQLDAVAAHALADPQVEDRRVVERLGAEHQHGVGELEVGDASPAAPGAASARASSSRPGRAGARVDVVGVEPLAQQPAEQEGLLVGRLAADERGGAAAVAGDRGRRPRAPRPSEAAAARRASRTSGVGDALVDVDRLVGEAALVAEPAVVDARVLVRASTRRTLSSRTVNSTLHCDGQSVQMPPAPSMSHGRARKR